MEFLLKIFKTIKLITKNKLILCFVIFTLLVISIWSVTRVLFISRTDVKGIQVNKVSNANIKTAKNTPNSTQSAKLISNEVAKPTPTPTSVINPTSNHSPESTQPTSSSTDNNTNNQNNNTSIQPTPTLQQVSATPTPANQPIASTDPTATPNPQQPSPTVIVVLHPGGGGGVEVRAGGYEYVYVTPTPNLGPFEASFSYDKDDGQATIIANKPIKSCESIQKNPSGNEVLIGKSPMPIRWSCPDGKCGYICELIFGPPGSFNYDWPYGAKVVSEMDEEKTFGVW